MLGEGDGMNTIEKLNSYIPDGDGYNSDYADTLSAAVEELERMQWVRADQELPEDNTDVLCRMVYDDRNADAYFVGQHIAPFTVLADVDDDSAEYSEDEDEYYSQAGWYELQHNWGDYRMIRVTEGTVTHWQHLPPEPKE
jgi:hypothetical protein